MSETLNLCGVFSGTKRVTDAHSRHFLALSVLFLLPLSYSLIIYPTLKTTQSNSILLYTLLITLLTLCAVATITYSTSRGFHDRPVELISSIKSILYSFLPLVATLIVFLVLVVLAALVPALFVGFASKCLTRLGFQIDLDSGHFVVFVGIVGGLFLIWVQVNWSLVFVIVVLESKWGFEPLRRSAYLVKGMRGVALSLLLFSGSVIGLLLWYGSTRLQTLFASIFLAVFMLQHLAATVVLYMSCKDVHDEPARDFDEEFSPEYASLLWPRVDSGSRFSW